MGYGMAEVAGLLPQQYGPQYAEAVGYSIRWSIQQHRDTGVKTCFSAYLANVKANIIAKGFPWDDKFEENLRNEANQLDWLNMDC